MEDGEAVQRHNEKILGQEVEPEKEKITQECPDCQQIIESDETELYRNRHLREHRQICPEYPHSQVNISRRLRSSKDQSKQEQVKLSGKKANDIKVIKNLREKLD